jgi:transposase
MAGKAAVLAAGGVLYAGAGRVSDPVFGSSPFFDPQDLVQVKYEMVRRVRVDGVAVATAARSFGFARNTFYTAAAALDAAGPAGLVPGKPGPKGPRKLTDPVMEWVEASIAGGGSARAKDLADLVAREFGFTVHPRSIERRLARRREQRDREPAI